MRLKTLVMSIPYHIPKRLGMSQLAKLHAEKRKQTSHVRIFCPREMLFSYFVALVDGHSVRSRLPSTIVFQIRHLRQILRLLLLTHNLPLTHIRLKPPVKIMQTHRTIRNRQDNQNDRQDRENRQRRASCIVLCAVTWLVDADELEEEVGERGDVEADGGNHAGFDFFACPESS